MSAHRPTRRSPSSPASRSSFAGLAGLLAVAALLALGLTLTGACASGGGGGADEKKVLVLGFDGMDYGMTKRLMEAGELPNMARLAAMGAFDSLGTSVPPQSPVAWSNFITGMDSGGHGIFDFIHRHPDTMIPYLSTSEAEPAERVLKLGKYQVPLDGGDIRLLRKGETFWEVLERRGVPSTIIRMPANYPTSGKASRELSGMGTPDLAGTPGMFSFYTTDLFAFYGEEISGGEVYEIFLEEGAAEGVLYGPENPFLAEPTKTELPFTIHVDPEEPLAKVVLGDEEVLLTEGEWSDWVTIDFEFIPTQGIRGIARLYLKQVRPELELYISPVNFDPLDPAAPISTPSSYAEELAEATGRFYTQGMPEDTRAFDEGVLSREEYLEQAKITGDEIRHQYEYVLDNFDRGFLFYYFGNLDLISHMSWAPMDPGHPAYDPDEDAKYGQVVTDMYRQFDEIVGYTLERIDSDTMLIVMSDHGFSTWRRSFSLNTWLYENGYLAVEDEGLMASDPGYFANIDWSGTRAYGFGINGLYINVRGRERDGIVAPADREALMEEIANKLLAVADPSTGEPAVTKVYRREEIYKDRGSLEIGPDMLVGYAKGTRGSDQSATAAVPPEVFSDNLRAWSGDHCMDHEAVPGILLSSRPLMKPAPRLEDLAAAIVAEFGVEQFPVRQDGDRRGP